MGDSEESFVNKYEGGKKERKKDGEEGSEKEIGEVSREERGEEGCDRWGGKEKRELVETTRNGVPQMEWEGRWHGGGESSKMVGREEGKMAGR